MQAPDHDRANGAAIVRLASWATAAAIAIFAAALAGLTPTGSERVDAAIAALTGADIRASSQPSRQAEIETDRRSFNEAIRILAADRDRLMARVNTLERNLNDITGSIKSQMIAPRPTAETPSVQQSSPTSVTEAAPIASAASSASENPAEASSAPSIRVTALPAQGQAMSPTDAMRSDLGVDIGGAADLKALRNLWNAARARHGPLLGNLQPIVVRRADQAGKPAYRLVVGPLNAFGAAKLCAELGASNVVCSARPYQGERLSP